MTATTTIERTAPLPHMTATKAEPGGWDRRRAARIAGWGYVALFLLAIFANFLVLERLVVADDAGATLANIERSTTGFRLGLVAFLAIFVIDLVAAWALHIVFRDHDHDRSLLAAWSRLVYTVFLGVGLVWFFQVLHLIEVGAARGGGAAVDRTRVEAQVMSALDAFDAAWMIGLVVFGLHLIVLGSLVVTSRSAPRALGVLLVVAGVAYVADTVVRALVPDHGSVEGIVLVVVAVSSVVAEGWFGLWLLLRAGRPGSIGDDGRVRIASQATARRD